MKIKLKNIKNIIRQVLLYPTGLRILRRVCIKILQFYYKYYKGYPPEQSYEQFIKEVGVDIKEHLSTNDAKSIKSLVCRVRRNGMLIVEVGSWKGYSTSVLAKEVDNCNGKVFAIDHWGGTQGVWNWDAAKEQDIYSIFRCNMKFLGVWDRIVYPLIMDSSLATGIFANEILDFVFLDGDHRYNFFKKDVLSWLPKLKEGGIICGHDCEGYYDDYSKESKKMIDKHLEEDFIPGMCHPGIVKGLYEIFGRDYSIVPDVVWYYIKNKSHPIA